MRNKRTSGRLLRACLLSFILVTTLNSCVTSRMGVVQKVGLIVGTAGVAGAAMSYQSAGATAGGMVAGGLVAATSAVIADTSPATSQQIARVEGTAELLLARMPEKHRQELAQKGIRHISVATTQSRGSRGETAVMVYDIEKKKVAEPVVFDVRVAPKVGSTVQFDTYVTEYVGTGEDTSFME